MIVRPNPRAWQSMDMPTEIYFHREDPVGWPGALTLFAKSVETRYYDWYAGSGYGALDDDLAWIFEELESRASQSLDLEEGDYGRLWTSESLMAFLAENLQALAVDTSGYWHYMPLGEDEDWRSTGALYQNSFGYRVW
jgi:hypothetical protein